MTLLPAIITLADGRPDLHRAEVQAAADLIRRCPSWFKCVQAADPTHPPEVGAKTFALVGRAASLLAHYDNSALSDAVALCDRKAHEHKWGLDPLVSQVFLLDRFLFDCPYLSPTGFEPVIRSRPVARGQWRLLWPLAEQHGGLILVGWTTVGDLQPPASDEFGLFAARFHRREPPRAVGVAMENSWYGMSRLGAHSARRRSVLAGYGGVGNALAAAEDR